MGREQLNNYCPECSVLCQGRFCWRCGKKTVSGFLKCPFCEEEVSVIGKFCTNCGKPIQEAIEEHVRKEREEVNNADSNTGNKDN